MKKQLTENENYIYSYLIRSGVFLAPFHHGYIMYRHSQKDLNNVLDVIESAFENLNKI